MAIKASLMDEPAVKRALMRITHEIIERNKGCDDLCLVGIRRRGVPMAEILCENLCAVEGRRVPSGALDITHYRDDREETSPVSDPVNGTAGIAGLTAEMIHGKHVVLVDDVLYTGRTIRAAIEALFSVGRPATVQLAVLIDRGHRELPIRPDYVGKNVPTSREEHIDVHFTELDGDTAVYLCDDVHVPQSNK